jgi:hypothetical protein
MVLFSGPNGPPKRKLWIDVYVDKATSPAHWIAAHTLIWLARLVQAFECGILFMGVKIHSTEAQ